MTTSTKTFYHYLDSVYTQGGGDCPEMTITGIELALEASRPNSLIYVFTDSSAKDYNRTNNVLNLIQQKQSQVEISSHIVIVIQMSRLSCFELNSQIEEWFKCCAKVNSPDEQKGWECLTDVQYGINIRTVVCALR